MKNLLFSIVLLLVFTQCKNKPLPAADQMAEWAEITSLAPEIDESSGLAMINGQLWTHNDSGDDPWLYQIAADTAQLIRKVYVRNAQNIDWEDLTADETYLYVGDFGNNGGKRQNLRIYKIPIATLIQDSVDAALISFRYPDQERYDHEAYQHNFDCEGMISVGDSLYLFSKNHLDKRCKLYGLPKVPGDYTAELIDAFDSKGLITAAAYDQAEGIICLVGYNFTGGSPAFVPFVWLISELKGRQYFDGSLTQLVLPKKRQTEGIESIGQGRFLISTEKEDTPKAFLYELDGKKYIK